MRDARLVANMHLQPRVLPRPSLWQGWLIAVGEKREAHEFDSWLWSREHTVHEAHVDWPAHNRVVLQHKDQTSPCLVRHGAPQAVGHVQPIFADEHIGPRRQPGTYVANLCGILAPHELSHTGLAPQPVKGHNSRSLYREQLVLHRCCCLNDTACVVGLVVVRPC
jgi:hypothetical protein